MPFEGSTIAAATTLSFTGGVINDTFNIGGTDVDMFAVTLEAGRVYEFDVDSGNDSYLRIFDARGRELKANDDGADLGEVLGVLPYTQFYAPYTGIYYIAFSPYYLRTYDPTTTLGRANPGNALATVTSTLTVTDRGVQFFPDANAINLITQDQITDNTDLLTNHDGNRQQRVEYVTATNVTSGDIEMGRFDLRKGDVVVIDINGYLPGSVNTLDSVLRVFNSAGSPIAFDNDSGALEDSEVVFVAPADGAYYIAVTGVGNTVYNAIDGSGASASDDGTFTAVIHINPTGIGTSLGNVRTGTVDDDYIVLMAGNDTADAGDGADTVSGGDDNDILNGEAGNDYLYGDFGDDALDGGSGDDVLDGGAGNDTVNGGTGNDYIAGGAGNDILNGQDGNDTIYALDGNDTVDGGANDDVITLGAALTAADSINGGTGFDQAAISGNYGAGLVFGATTMTNVEVLALLPGGTNSYNLTTNNATVAAGVEMTIFASNLAVGENFTFFGSAETDGFFRIFGGFGTDTLFGGELNDGFYFGPGKWQAGDSVNGGGGTGNQLALDGNYAITIGAEANVEVLVLLEGPVSTPNTFNITLSNLWTDPGQTKTVFGRNVTTNLTVNGAAETSGNFTIFGGRGSDTLTSGGGNDTIYGLEGNDTITGGAGSDTAVYQGARADYSVLTGGGNVQIVDNNPIADGTDGIDTVVSIEFARFSDQTISITSPIILDLDGGGVETLSAAASNAAFDMDGDGIGDDTSWFGRGEGLLFLDRDGNGTVSNAGEFSFVDDVPGARSDLEGLRAWDSNGDGELSRRDARFADFKIWQDRNGNGVVDRREVMTLRQAGVRSLSLTGTANAGTYALGDTAVVNTGSFTRTNGRQGGLIDAVLTAVSSKAETDALAAMRDAVASDVGSADTDPRVALMTQDMASFGPTRAATETDRWRREGVPQFDMFAA